jgi:Tfp pilus assembly protein PilF
VLARIEAARRHETAETHLRAILAGNVDGYVIRLLLARVLLAKEDLAGARTELEAAVRLDPERLDAYGGLMEIARRQNDAALARQVTERLVAVDEHDREALTRFVQILAAEGKHAELVALAPRIRIMLPESFDAHLALATSFVETRAFAEARKDAELARRITPTSGPAALVLARALAGSGQRAEARRMAQEAVRLDASLADRARDIR